MPRLQQDYYAKSRQHYLLKGEITYLGTQEILRNLVEFINQSINQSINQACTADGHTTKNDYLRETILELQSYTQGKSARIKMPSDEQLTSGDEVANSSPDCTYDQAPHLPESAAPQTSRRLYESHMHDCSSIRCCALPKWLNVSGSLHALTGCTDRYPMAGMLKVVSKSGAAERDTHIHAKNPKESVLCL